MHGPQSGAVPVVNHLAQDTALRQARGRAAATTPRHRPVFALWGTVTKLALAVLYALVPTALKLAVVLVIRHPLLTARRQQVIHRRLKARAVPAIRLYAGAGAFDDFLRNTADDPHAGRPTVSPQGPEH